MLDLVACFSYRTFCACHEATHWSPLLGFFCPISKYVLISCLSKLSYVCMYMVTISSSVGS